MTEVVPVPWPVAGPSPSRGLGEARESRDQPSNLSPSRGAPSSLAEPRRGKGDEDGVGSAPRGGEGLKGGGGKVELGRLEADAIWAGEPLPKPKGRRRLPPGRWPRLGRESRTVPSLDNPPCPRRGLGSGGTASGQCRSLSPPSPGRPAGGEAGGGSGGAAPAGSLPSAPAGAYQEAALVPTGPLPGRAVGRRLQPRSPRLLTRGFFSFIKTQSCGDVTSPRPLTASASRGGPAP